MPPAPAPTHVQTRDAIVRDCHGGLPVPELVARVSRRLRRAVPFDMAGWLTLDPATLLFTGVVVQGEIPPDTTRRFFENEIEVADFAKFADLARASRPVAVLSEATGGEPHRSARHRHIYGAAGLDAELRAGLSIDGVGWGAVCLSREAGRPDFTEADAAFVGGLCEHLAHGLRAALAVEAAAGPAPGGPGLLVLGPDGAAESATAEAQAWLGELGQGPEGVPAVVHGVAARARALAAGEGGPAARARVRTRGGRWCSLHASVLPSGGQGPDRVAVIVEAARAAEIAPLIVQVHELSERERQVVELLVQGLSTEDIARRLVISRHTLRDHVKAVFAKFGVSSRPELTARLFADHYAPAMVTLTGPAD